MKNQYGMLMTIVLLLGCVELSPIAQAVSPPPDGGYGGQNTAEGTDALFHLITGVWNSAFAHFTTIQLGFETLPSASKPSTTPTARSILAA